MYDKPDHADWDNSPRDVKTVNDLDFYDYTPPKRFSILFLGRLLPLYILVFGAILLGVALVEYKAFFAHGVLFDAELYLDTWLIFSWVLTPTLIWMGIAGTISYRNYAKTWYIWTSIILGASLALTWLVMPEWSKWMRLHLFVSVACHVLIFLQLDAKPYPKSFLQGVYGIGVGIATLNIITLFFI